MSSELTGLENETTQEEYENDFGGGGADKTLSCGYTLGRRRHQPTSVLGPSRLQQQASSLQLMWE